MSHSHAVTEFTRSFCPSVQELQKNDGDTSIIQLVQGTLTNGEPFYAFLAIPPSKFVAFKRAEQKGQYDLCDYGIVLAYGKGKMPLPDVVDRMKRVYGVDFNTRETILDTLFGVEGGDNENFSDRH